MLLLDTKTEGNLQAKDALSYAHLKHKKQNTDTAKVLAFNFSWLSRVEEIQNNFHNITWEWQL